MTAGFPAPPTDLLEEAALLLSLAARPVIWAGGGAVASGAWRELGRVAEALGAPVVTSTSGKGAVSEDHPLALGSLWGAAEVARMLGNADAALAVGTSFSARSTRAGSLPLPMQLFHVDVDAAVFGRRYPVRSGIPGDAREVLGGLLDGLAGRPAGPGRDGAAERVAPVRAAARERLGAGAPDPGLIDALRRAIPAEVPTVWDPDPARWGVPLFPVTVPGSFHVAPAGAPAGWAPPEAARVAAGHRGPAVALVAASEPGDVDALAGGGLPVVVVSWGPDAVARGSSLRSVRVDDEPGLALSIAEALTSPAPTLIVVEEAGA